MAVGFLREKKGDNFIYTFNEDGQSTARYLSLSKFITSLYHKDTKYNGPKPDEVPYVQSNEFTEEMKRREELRQA